MIRVLINLYIIVLIVGAILSYLPQVRHYKWAMYIRKISDYTLNPVRRYLPKDLPFDFSVIIVIILLKLIEELW